MLMEKVRKPSRCMRIISKWNDVFCFIDFFCVIIIFIIDYNYSSPESQIDIVYFKKCLSIKFGKKKHAGSL